MNMDALWSDLAGRGGINWVVRDSEGSLIFFGMKEISQKWLIKLLEALAILEGMKCMKDTYKGSQIPRSGVSFA